MRKFIIPIFIIAFGVLWLLDVQGIMPSPGVLWTGGLAAIGIAVFAARGFNKETFPWGAFFLAAAVCSALRQADQLEFKIELPLLIIILGVLLGVNQTALIPEKTPPQR